MKTIIIPYGTSLEKEKQMIQELINQGYLFYSSRFVGPDLMDQELTFKKA